MKTSTIVVLIWIVLFISYLTRLYLGAELTAENYKYNELIQEQIELQIQQKYLEDHLNRRRSLREYRTQAIKEGYIPIREVLHIQ